MVVVENVPVELWSNVADRCSYATFFHTPTWARIVSNTYPHRYKIATRAFEFGHDDYIVLPMMEAEQELRGFFRRLSSNVFGVYGGFIATQPLTHSKITQIVDYLQSIRVKRIDIFGNPFAPPETALSGWCEKPNFTHLFLLDHLAGEQEIFGAYTRLMRNHVHRAVRAGYTCCQAVDIQEVKDYVGIYEQALSRYGDKATGRQQPRLFLNFFEDGGDAAKFWLVKKEGRVAGGALVFYHGRHCVAWHAAFGTDDLPFGIAKLLHHNVILDAKKNNYAMYDFNPSGGHEGTAKFKEMFGAVRRPFTGYQWENNMYKIYRRVRTLLPSGNHVDD